MLASRIQPTYLTNVCQAGFKKCLLNTDMDYCAHLLHDCVGSKNFTQPVEIVLPERPKELSLEFTEKENEVNALRCKKQKFYDRFICRHLCSQSLVLQSKRNKAFSACEFICFELTRSYDFAGEVCPFEKYCRTGCPCPFYQCEKIENEQALIPFWDLKKTKFAKGKLAQVDFY